ncbi:SMI1/KNR4 family protein [Microbispora bryophytorum]|uniref:SMI1/KNR4 family protein n=1 Tax=Microbispora bryophytorum TaxID=1460882 RepID=UPI003724389E
MSAPYAWSDLFPAAAPLTEGPDHPQGAPGGCLRPPAGESEIRRLEERLGLELPPSYRQFLLFADGWGAEDDEYCIRSVATVGWLRDLEPWLAEAWGPEGETPRSVPDDLYFVYGKEQDCINLREEYVPDTLLVGHWNDGVTLLNPQVKTPEGEWEAWFLAPWLPGASRYRSFWDLMEAEG